MENKGYLELILAYEEDKLSVEKQQVFDTALSEDPGFKSFYDDWKASKTIQDVLAYDELRTKIQHIAKKKPIVRLSIRRYMSIAASILVLVVGLSVFFANKNYSNQSLAKDNYSVPNFSINRDAAVVSQFEKAKVQFGQQNYSATIDLLENTTNNQELYLLAHALYQNDSFEKATAVFNQLESSNDSRVSLDAQWFEAISMLNGSDLKNAKNILTGISVNNEHPYKKDAEKLLILLNSKIRIIVFN